MTSSPMVLWVDRAACRDTHRPEDFYPETLKRNSAAYVDSCERATAHCNACEVSAECLAYALEHSRRDGVHGGTTSAVRIATRMGQRVTVVPRKETT